MVEHLVANQMMGVRFSLPAQNTKAPEGAFVFCAGKQAKKICLGESKAGARRREAGSRKFLARNYV